MSQVGLLDYARSNRSSQILTFTSCRGPSFDVSELEESYAGRNMVALRILMCTRIRANAMSCRYVTISWMLADYGSSVILRLCRMEQLISNAAFTRCRQSSFDMSKWDEYHSGENILALQRLLCKWRLANTCCRNVAISGASWLGKFGFSANARWSC
jgi:hypothetical protein